MRDPYTSTVPQSSLYKIEGKMRDPYIIFHKDAHFCNNYLFNFSLFRCYYWFIYLFFSDI